MGRPRRGLSPGGGCDSLLFMCIITRCERRCGRPVICLYCSFCCFYLKPDLCASCCCIPKIARVPPCIFLAKVMHISTVQTDTKDSYCCYSQCGFGLSRIQCYFHFCVHIHVQKVKKMHTQSSQSRSPSYTEDQKNQMNNKRQGFNV